MDLPKVEQTLLCCNKCHENLPIDKFRICTESGRRIKICKLCTSIQQGCFKPCIICTDERSVPRLPYCQTCIDIFSEEKLFYCSQCTEIKEWSCFTKKSDSFLKLCKTCKNCSSINLQKQELSFKSFITSSYHLLLERCKYRESKGRHKAAECNITVQDLIDMFKNQQGLCYYSGLKMNIQRHSNWRCSVERLDPELGYIIGNVVFVCLEFNCVAPWSREKVISVLTNQSQQSNSIITNDEISKAKIKSINGMKKGTQKIPQHNCIVINDEVHKECRDCLEIKLLTNFLPQNNRCSPCRKQNEKRRKSSLRCKLGQMLSASRVRTNGWQSKTDATVPYDLSLEFLFEQMENQRRLCYYSQMPLRFNDTNWVISLERLDVRGWYTKNNVVLICHEFNSTDCRKSSKDETVDTGGSWNVEKFEYFLKHTTIKV